MIPPDDELDTGYFARRPSWVAYAIVAIALAAPFWIGLWWLVFGE